ncbi:biotin/lipoyl-binding protein [Acetatifactor muris]|uniref:Multidrug resistance protein MdtA n=1 Tax=Acetatifactor muris TaxID=879566 RepID=A0A2K4ZDG8_9FIRM|nr:biotin/lipoyl-binding protein [Acetatifactor muris]MCR2046895.1 biotin/lipoyl-binding protein [Acetatifactor muris]SOY28519.1 Multidrug resistance protein MdtA [Acetatifactor muris]
MRRNLLWALMIVAMSVGLAACGIMPQEEELPAAPVIRSYEAEEYRQATVMRGDIILEKTVRCVYASARQEMYSFSLGGLYIDKIYVSEGDLVKKGDLLAELEKGNLAQQISDGEYALRAMQIRQANLPESQRLELARQDATIAGMDERIDRLMVKAELAGQKEEKSAFIDQANETLIQKLELEAQEDDIREAQEKQLQEMADSVYIGELRLRELKEELRERQIYAGISGTVIHVQKVKEGERSVKGKNIITIADLDKVVFTVKGEDARYFTAGMQVTVLCNRKEYPAQAVEATELGLSQSQEDSEPVAYLQLLQPDPTLENGASGNVHVILDQREDVTYVDKKAIKTADGRQFVYMLDEDGLRIRQEVTTGLESGDFVEIINGLTEGDSVILE